jgi:hypothetical protein
MNLSKEMQEWVKEKIFKFQQEAFIEGRQAALKALIGSFVLMDESFFTKENILDTLHLMIENGEKMNVQCD